MSRLHIVLDERQHARLAAFAVERNLSVGAAVSEATDAFASVRGLVCAGPSGSTSIACSLDRRRSKPLQGALAELLLLWSSDRASSVCASAPSQCVRN